MREQMKEAGRRGDNHYSHFGPQANLFEELETTFAAYSESGGGHVHLHSRRAEGPTSTPYCADGSSGLA